MSPPTASTSSAISRAVRSGVPLNSRCSRKCEMPDCSGVSSREPVPTQTPTHSDATSGIDSVTSRMPLSSVVIVIMAAEVPAPRLLTRLRLSAPRSVGRRRGRARPAGRPRRRRRLSELRRGPPAAAVRRRGRPDRGRRRSTRARSRRRPRTRARRRAPPVASPSPAPDRTSRFGARGAAAAAVVRFGPALARRQPQPEPSRRRTGRRRARATPCPAGRSRRRGPRPPGRA